MKNEWTEETFFWLVMQPKQIPPSYVAAAKFAVAAAGIELLPHPPIAFPSCIIFPEIIDTRPPRLIHSFCWPSRLSSSPSSSSDMFAYVFEYLINHRGKWETAGTNQIRRKLKLCRDGGCYNWYRKCPLVMGSILNGWRTLNLGKIEPI